MNPGLFGVYSLKVEGRSFEKSFKVYRIKKKSFFIHLRDTDPTGLF